MKIKTTLMLFFLAYVPTQVQWLNAQCNGATFEEQNGIVVIQAESTSLASGWRRETSSGFTGSSHLAWRGSNSFNNPGNGTIQYKVRINTTGTYRFAWRSRIGIVASSNANTEHNDSWLRMPDASLFYGQRGSSRVYPRGSGRTPNPEGASSNNWFKIYTNTISWNWDTLTSDFDPHVIYATFNSPGVYTIQISGRSNGHFIDRMVLYQESRYSFSSATATSRSETRCDGSNPTDPTDPGNNNAPSVTITSPSNGQTIAAGSTVTVQLNASDSDGSIAQHQIFLNNSLVDTDGSNYSAYQMTNIAAGSYTLRARVTDNDGATDESTVSFTVSGDGGVDPDPTDPPSGSNSSPTVTITSPSNGQNLSAGSAVSVNLSSNDSDGSVVRHQVYVNGILVDTDGANFTPHRISNLSAGNYTVRAVVTDNDGSTSEASVAFTVGGSGSSNGNPTVSITSPSNGQNFSAGSTVSVNLSASDSDGSIAQYRIFVNGTLVDTDGPNFTPHPIRNVTAGTYTVRAVVTDNDGATAETSSSFTVGGASNANPSVSITNPSNGQNFSSGSNTQINVSASDSDGSVVRYQIYVNGRLVDTDGANFTPHPLNNLSQGTYAVRVVATDDDGATSEDNLTFTVGAGVASTATQNAAQALIYPNPTTTGDFTIRIPDTMNGTITYAIANVVGVALENGTLDAAAGGEVNLSLPASGASNAGIYYVILTDASGQSQTLPVILAN